MLKSRLRIISVYLALLSCVLLVQIPAGAVTGRAVSLNALVAAVKSGNADDARHLCGITRILGYVPDTKSNDIVLIGQADPNLPELHLEDLAVAVRNVWLEYAEIQGGAICYSPPGCSIDPDPKMVKDLQDVASNAQVAEPDATPQYVEQWNTIGTRPQNVRVLGIPLNTHFAKVMVDADYFMKQLVNGSVAIDVKDIKSLTDMTADEVNSEITSGKFEGIAVQSFNRFWFSPGEFTYSEDDGVIRLRTCKVDLLTEEEYLSEHGEVQSTGQPNHLAKKFAQNFTRHYSEIATVKPVYTELEQLFRFVAIGKLMKNNGARCSGLTYLLDDFKVNEVSVSRTLPGVTNVKQITGKEPPSKDTASQGQATIEVLCPSCGGVSMDIKPKKVPPADKPKSPAVTPGGGNLQSLGLRQIIFSNRKSPKTLSWDFPIPPPIENSE